MRFRRSKYHDDEIMSFIQDNLEKDINKTIENEPIEINNSNIPEFDKDKVFYKIMNQVRKDERSIIKPILRWACVIALILTLGSITYYMSREENAELNEIYAAKGEKLIVILSDGTKVHLNSDSHLTYPLKFAGVNRKVSLKGEAYFEVKKDSDHPFIVNAYDMMIKVTGTKFNVQAYPEDSDIITTLDEGKIMVGKLEKHPQLNKLIPGEQAIYKKGGSVCTVIKINDSQDQSSWKNNQFIISNEYLSSILKIMERNYDVSFKITNPKILNYTYNINCSSKDINDVIDIIETITPVHFKKINENLYEVN